MKLIEQNPFRMLGIPVNAGARDFAANKGKMRLLDVGKEVAFPLDLVGLLSPIARTSESVTAAERDTNQPHDKVRHALFWFAKPTSQLGAMAYNNLLSGNIDTAWRNFQRSQDWESKLCLSTICLQKGDIINAFEAITLVIDEYCKEFVAAVAGLTYTVDVASVRQDYITALASEMDVAELYSQLKDACISPIILDEVRHKAVEMPIAAIERAIMNVKATNQENAQAQLDAGRSLVKVVRKNMPLLEHLLGKSDLRYTRLSDKVANQILQCSINYHNATDHVSASVVETCIKMVKYARDLAFGKLVQQRIDESIKTLENKKAELPPAGVESEFNAIMNALKTFVEQPDRIVHSVTLLNTVKPYLESVKSRLGVGNAFYLKLSSQIVNNALHNLVIEVNAAQESEVIDIEGTKFRVGSEKTKSALKAAWNCTKLIESLDMDTTTKTHFNTNKDTLRYMCSQMGVSTNIFSTGGNVSQPRLNSSKTLAQSRQNTSNKDNEHFIASLILVEIVWIIIAAIAASNDGDFWGVFIGGSLIGWSLYVNYLAMIFFNWLLSKILD